MLIITWWRPPRSRVRVYQKPTKEISVATIIIVERNTPRQSIIIIILHAEHTDYDVPHVSYASGDTMRNESCVRVPITYK